MDGFQKLHQKYFEMNLKVLPSHYTSNEASRMTLGFFCLSAMDLLNIPFEESKRLGWIDWIYAQEINGGFRGGPFVGSTKELAISYDVPHITMIYTALLSLLILGDDLAKVDRNAIIRTISQCQNSDGSVTATPNGPECDLRFLFSACSICYILGDWSGLDVETATTFVKKCRNYDGAFGVGPNRESHGI